LRAAQFQAQKEAFETLIFRTGLQGEASVIGREIATQLGETTVTLKGNGKGGRNQDLALAAVDVLSGLKDVMLISLATDGEDGPTDAAGAVATGESAQRAGMLGLTAPAHLSRNDAYSYFASLGDLIRTGASGTNVNDLVICFAF
jgi:hydroxypyruvate reductase